MARHLAPGQDTSRLMQAYPVRVRRATSRPILSQ